MIVAISASEKKALIVGASGSVGTFAVQIARVMGAEVTGVCSSRNIELVKSLGAANVIDYTQEDFTAGSARYDLIFDAVGKTSKANCKRALAPGGQFLTILKGGPNERERLEILNHLKVLIEAGKIKSFIDRVYPLSEVAEAHRYAESGRKKGNVVIKIA